MRRLKQLLYGQQRFKDRHLQDDLPILFPVATEIDTAASRSFSNGFAYFELLRLNISRMRPGPRGKTGRSWAAPGRQSRQEVGFPWLPRYVRREACRIPVVPPWTAHHVRACNSARRTLPVSVSCASSAHLLATRCWIVSEGAASRRDLGRERACRGLSQADGCAVAQAKEPRTCVPGSPTIGALLRSATGGRSARCRRVTGTWRGRNRLAGSGSTVAANTVAVGV